MKARPWFWFLVCLLCLGGAWYAWRAGDRWAARQRKVLPRPAESVRSASTAPKLFTLPAAATNAVKAAAAAAATNKFAYRLSNTREPIGRLARDDQAILLANALIDTSRPLLLAIPRSLRTPGDPGAYIVQSRGPMPAAFQARLRAAGARPVAYIPNNAWLVRADKAVADKLAGDPLTQAVLPYEPYYKLDASLMGWVGRTLPPEAMLNVAAYPDTAEAARAALEGMGATIVGLDRSPFGEVFTVRGVGDVAAVARIPALQIVEPFHPRQPANDLSRVAVGVAADTITKTNYMNLTGKNVTVEVNDTGIDTNHPDLTGRVLLDFAGSGNDTDGHGTHVAGIIAGDGAKSYTIDLNTNTLPSGSVLDSNSPNADFRGMAPAAALFSVGALNGGHDTNYFVQGSSFFLPVLPTFFTSTLAEGQTNFFVPGRFPDWYLQEAAAATNALISNNSWDNGDPAYDLAAASYDAATRDALPGVGGSQPVLFVFAAGNAGGGKDDGSGGNPDSILSPGTAKDVITVGAIEEFRNITKVVTNLFDTPTTPWQPETDSGYQVAGFSSRGNTGIGVEGGFGRFKPDVVAPGTFVVSTRSGQWDQAAYYNPTNYHFSSYTFQQVVPDTPIYYDLDLSTHPNTVGVSLQLVPNSQSAQPFSTNLWLYVRAAGYPTPATYDILSKTNAVNIPPDGGAGYLATAIAQGNLFLMVTNTGTAAVNYDVDIELVTTNDNGNELTVLSNLNNTLGKNPNGPWYYRYETGTSMSAADVSGVLALMQDYFTNQLGTLPSPALLKAMLINGARPTGFYNLQVANPINFEGWGLVNLPDSLPTNLTSRLDVPCAGFFQDQSTADALATGQRRTLFVTATNVQPLRVTLAWTDPPGDPAAAIKLVNNLELVVTNLDDPTNPIIYYGNDIPAQSDFNSAHGTNSPPTFDTINNIQNVYLPPGAGTNFSVTVLGWRVNVNAVSAQTNDFNGAYAPDIVQDYALVISSGEGQITNALTVSATSPLAPGPSYSANPTGDQQITYVATGLSGTSGPLLNQRVGANSPLLGTNTLQIGAGSQINGLTLGASPMVVTVGQTDQWHFYVVTNTTGFTNAAFVTFAPPTLSVPRMGALAGTLDNATRPEADIDLYVSTNPGLTNLDPVVVSNADKSLGRLGEEFVAYSNSVQGEIYYVGVKSEDQMSALYNFLPIFSQTPFSVMRNGNEIVTGVPVPAAIPGGNPAVPGYTDVVGIALYPITMRRVVVANALYAEDLGDLVGAVTHNGRHVILNNHSLPVNGPGGYEFIYDDSGQNDVLPDPNPPLGYTSFVKPSDGPGSLSTFVGQQGVGVWILHESDNVAGYSNVIDSFNLTIEPHVSHHGTTVTTTVTPGTWFYDYVDVPPGATNLTITVTNLTATGEVDLYEKYGAQPTLTNYDRRVAIIPPATVGTLSVGPPLTAGRYWYGIYNPGTIAQELSITVNVGLGAAPGQVVYPSTDTPKPIPDEAVMDDSIFVPDDQIISSLDVGIAVEHPRISDLVFHLIGPDGTRVLLMENRGGTSTNGAGGAAFLTTNAVMAGSFEGLAGDYAAGQTVAGWTVSSNQVSVVNDPTNAYPGASSYLALANGTLSATVPTVAGQTYTLSFAYRGPGIVGWWRAEGNANDSIYGNNGTLANPTYLYYTNGEVGSSFFVNTVPPGTYVGVDIPDSPSYVLTNSLSIEGWIRPVGGGVVFYRGDNRTGFDPYAISVNNSPELFFDITDGADNVAQVASQPLNYDRWYHIAATLDGNSGTMNLYINGILVGQTKTAIRPLGNLIATDHPGVGIGNVNDGYNNFPFYGAIDEMSLYNRALSASEVQAIYDDGIGGNPEGGNGKFAPAEFSVSPAQSLAEAAASVNGGAPIMFTGDNTNWQTTNITFTATQNAATLQLAGMEPGMLLDAVNLTTVETNYSYLVFTENTNLTTTPIKFAPAPFTPGPATNTAAVLVYTNNFEGLTATDAGAGQTVAGWTVTGNQVSVATDPVTSDGGTNYLALANGTIATILPTVAGDTYTLTFACRGPGLVHWWRGESGSSAVDVIGGNNGALMGNVTLTNAEVGQGYYFNGSDYINVPFSPALQFTNQFTLETWWEDIATPIPGGYGLISDRHMDPQPVNFAINVVNNNGLGGLGIYYNDLNYFWPGNTSDDQNDLETSRYPVIPSKGVFHHLAAVYRQMGVTNIELQTYLDGQLVRTKVMPGNFSNTLNTDAVTIGTTSTLGEYLTGIIDEMSIYNRALSASEVNAIYTARGAGKFDPAVYATSPAQSLAKAQVSVIGQAPTTIYGSDTNWQTQTITFTATQDGTPLQIIGTKPGMLLDNFALTQVSSGPDLYYLPEQPLDAFDGQDAYGNWTLEVQDDRAGAGPTNWLASWQLRFIYTTAGGVGSLNVVPPPTNTIIPAGGLEYYLINVPANASFATNLLSGASEPLNLWFNQTSQPTGTGAAGDYLLLSGVTNGLSVLTTNSAPANIVPGGSYWLAVQNPNATNASYNIEVDFDVPGGSLHPRFTISAANVTSAGATLQWTAPTNDQFQVAWASSLTPPIGWTTNSAVITSTDGMFTFADSSATNVPTRFYRLILLP